MAHGHTSAKLKADIQTHVAAITASANAIPALDENASVQDLTAANVQHADLHDQVQQLAATVANAGTELREHEFVARQAKIAKGRAAQREALL